jgi:hypothetical protein
MIIGTCCGKQGPWCWWCWLRFNMFQNTSSEQLGTAREIPQSEGIEI